MKYLYFVNNAIRESLIVFLGIILINLVFSYLEEDHVLVAGTDSDSINVSVVVSESISISSPSDVAMSPDIVGSGTADGSATWNVSTNNTSGWKFEVEVDSTPAMQKDADYFSDYTEASAGVPESWSVANDASEFGFSSSGSYAESEYSNGTNFEGFSGSTKIQIASDSSATPGGGADVTAVFKAEVGVNKNQPSGTYSATVTATATTL